MNEEFLRKLRETLSHELGELAAALGEGLARAEAGDDLERLAGLADLALLAHSAKGAVMTLGAGPLLEVARGLERVLARAGAERRWLSGAELAYLRAALQLLREACEELASGGPARLASSRAEALGAPPPAPGAGPGTARPARADPRSGPLQVVVADDSETFRKVLRATLQTGGQFRVVAEASNGLEAIECTRAHLPDAVVMDLAMPTMNGFEATRRILDEVPTPVLLVSALDSVSEVDLETEHLDRASVALLPKPRMDSAGQRLLGAEALRESLRRLCDLPARRRSRNPMELNPPAPGRGGAEILGPASRRGEGREILVVEDSSFQAEALALALQEAGYQVRVCWDASEAWAKATREVPDLVLCDVILPGGSGFELCSALKATQATRHVPVAFLSAGGHPMQMARAYAAGAVAFLSKPWEAEALIERIHELLGSVGVSVAPGGVEEREVRVRAETLWVDPAPARILAFMVDAFEDYQRAQSHLEAGRLRLHLPSGAGCEGPREASGVDGACLD